MNQPDPFHGLTILGSAEVQQLLGVSSGYISHNLVKHKKLSFQKIKAGYVFLKHEVDALHLARLEKAKGDKRIRL